MKKYKDLKIFCLAFFAFLFANFLYENVVSKTVAAGITFKEVIVNVEGDIELDLKCSGSTSPNSADKNRGRGENTMNNCKGTGKIKAKFPTQRFIDKGTN